MPGKSIDDKTLWKVQEDSLIKDEPTIKYGLPATEILKKEYPTIHAGYGYHGRAAGVI